MQRGLISVATVIVMWSAILSAAPYLQPGMGWTGATAQPAQIGSGAGADRSAIAHWDVVPYQTIADTMNVGVLAYHFNDIDSVCFSVNNGPWLAVTQPLLNPESGAEEYWVTLDAAQFTKDTLVEIRAIAYPGTGRPKVMQGTPSNENSSLLLNVNSRGTLPHTVRYVSKTGHDSNSGTTPALACSSIAGAIIKACTGGSAGGSVDGAELRLGEGSWMLPDLGGWGKPVFATASQWLTFTAAPGTDSTNVIITGINGPADGAGLNTKLVRLNHLTMTGGIGKAPGGNYEDYFWVDHVRVVTVDNSGIATGNNWSVSGYAPFDGLYITDCYMNNMGSGPRGATLARNVYADTTGDGHASGSATVVNYTVNMVYGSTYRTGWPDYHGDVYQMYGRSVDIIIYNAHTVPGVWHSLRGIVSSTSAVADVAMINCDIDLAGQWAFSFYAPIDHMVVKNSRFVGSGNWYGEAGSTPDPDSMRNILIDHSVFENGNAYKVPYPYALPGIRYVPALSTPIAEPAAPVNHPAMVPTVEAAFTVYDMTGRMVMSGHRPNAPKDLSRGVYLIKIRNSIRKLLVLDEERVHP